MYLLDSIDKGTGLIETAGKEDPVELDFKIMLLSYLQGVDYVVAFFLNFVRIFYPEEPSESDEESSESSLESSGPE